MDFKFIISARIVVFITCVKNDVVQTCLEKSVIAAFVLPKKVMDSQSSVTVSTGVSHHMNEN